MSDAEVCADTRAAQPGHTPAVNLSTYTHTSLKAKREAVSKTARRLQAVPDQAAS
jgi:hypothetical protein